jgi:phosphonate transport system substrate-binding protein
MAIGVAVAQQDSASQPPATGDGGLRDARLYEIAKSSMFNGVNANDARAALKVWFEVLGRQKGFRLESKVDVVDSLMEIRDRLQKHSVDVVLLGTTDYLQLESSGTVEPVLTDARNSQGEELYSFLLLVNPASGVTSIAGLRGKDILVSSRDLGNTAGAWLDVLLSKEKLGRAASFFGSFRTSDKPQACILPLFFGKVDACVVDEVNLNLAKEMNPQLGRFRVLARSRPMLEGVICVPTEARLFRKEFVDSMLSLHLDPVGRQLLLVFKTDRIVRIRPGDLDSARELWSDYNRLPGSPPYKLQLTPSQAGDRGATDRGLEKR